MENKELQWEAALKTLTQQKQEKTHPKAHNKFIENHDRLTFQPVSKICARKRPLVVTLTHENFARNY